MDDDRDCHSTFEFKLIHNNKNWPRKVDEVWDDLFPSRAGKAVLRPRNGRIAIVGLIGKVYRSEVGGYPGQRDDLGRWEDEVHARLLPRVPWQGKNVRRVWTGTRHLIDHESLQPRIKHFFQLIALAAR